MVITNGFGEMKEKTQRTLEKILYIGLITTILSFPIGYKWAHKKDMQNSKKFIAKHGSGEHYQFKKDSLRNIYKLQLDSLNKDYQMKLNELEEK